MSDTKEVTTVVKAAARLDGLLVGRVFDRMAGVHVTDINPTATSSTLSRRAKSTKPSQAFRTRLPASSPAWRRASPLSSRRGILAVVVEGEVLGSRGRDRYLNYVAENIIRDSLITEKVIEAQPAVACKWASNDPET